MPDRTTDIDEAPLWEFTASGDDWGPTDLVFLLPREGTHVVPEIRNLCLILALS